MWRELQLTTSKALSTSTATTPGYILLGADAEYAFNRTNRGEMLQQTAQHDPLLIRLANSLYAKG